MSSPWTVPQDLTCCTHNQADSRSQQVSGYKKANACVCQLNSTMWVFPAQKFKYVLEEVHTCEESLNNLQEEVRTHVALFYSPLLLKHKYQLQYYCFIIYNFFIITYTIYWYVIFKCMCYWSLYFHIIPLPPSTDLFLNNKKICRIHIEN